LLYRTVYLFLREKESAATATLFPLTNRCGSRRETVTMKEKPMQGKGRFPMSAVRKRPPVTKRTAQQEINKKAIYWVVGSFAALVIIISTLIIVNG
jgi:hypothetical protein